MSAGGASAAIAATVVPNSDPIAMDNGYRVHKAETLKRSAPGVLGNDSDPDGDRLIVSHHSAPRHGKLVLRSGGSFVYTPNKGYNGMDSFTYTADDGNGGTDTATVEVTVWPVSRPVLARNDAYQGDEDDLLTVQAPGVLRNDSGVGGRRLFAMKVADPAHGSVTLSRDGSFVYTPDQDFNGEDSFIYKAKDRTGLSDKGTVSISVGALNDPPAFTGAAGNTSQTIDEGSGLSALEATDVDGDVLTFELTSGSLPDGITLGNDGSFSGNAGGRSAGNYTADIKVSDGNGESATTTLEITVNLIDDAPVAAAGTTSADEETAKTLTLSATDPDSNSLTFSAASPGHGTLGTLSAPNCSTSAGTTTCTATVEYTSNKDYNGPDSFTYKANDGNNDSDPATVDITVNAVNDAPVANDDTKSTPENTPLVFPASDLLTNDSEGAANESGQTLSVTEVKNAQHGTVDLQNGQITFTPQTDYNGSASFEYTVCDDGSPQECSLKAATVNVTVSPVNSAPVAQNGTETMDEDGTPITIDLGTLVSDAETSDADLAYAITSDPTPQQGNLSGSGPTFTFDSADNFNGTLEISYKVTDRGDPDDCGAPGADCAASKESETRTVTVTVSPVNDPPTNISLDNASVGENQPSGTVVGALSSDDPDAGDTFTYSLVSGTGSDDNGQFQITGSTLKTNAQFDFESKDTYSVRVQSDDGHGGTFEKVFTVKVTDANDAPTDIALSNSKVVEHQPSGTPIGTFSTTDQDTADTHTYSFATGEGDTDNASFQISGDELQTKADLAAGTYSVRVETHDGNGGTFQKKFEITVVPPNFAPTDIALSNDTVVENLPSGTDVGTLATTDQDPADTHTYTLVAGQGDTDNASFQITGSTLQTKASFDYEAKSSYSVRVQTDDGHGGTFEESFTISVTNANDNPTDIALSNNAVAENQPSGTTVGTLSTTDQDTADTHTYTLVSGTGSTDNGQFTISGGTLKTNAQFDYEAKASYTVRVQTDDGHGGTSSKQFTISITNANDKPTNIALSNNAVAENQPSGTTVGTLSTTDQDTADTHTYTLVSGTGSTDNGQFTISGDTLKTNAQFNYEAKSSYSILVQTDDGNGGTSEKQFTITVTNANDTPTNIALSSSSVAENQPSGTSVGTLSTTDEDTADTHTYTLVAGDGSTDNASFQISGSTLQTGAQFDFEAKNSYSIRLQTSDGNGGTFQKQFTITVTNANDAPTDIALTKSDVDENRPSGTPVGTFSTTDQDTADTHTYSLVTGTGDTNNASFQIVNGELRTSASFNFEVKNSYSIRVRTTDNGSPARSFDEQFTISVNDVNDAPVAGADSYSGAIGNTKASVGVTVTGEPVVALTGNVLTFNDSDEDATFPHTLSAVAETVSSTGGGTATINSDGSFTFLPGVGDKNQNDTFTYRVTDGTATATGTVTVGISNSLVWYADNSKATNGDGRSNAPFNSLTGVNGAGGSGDADGPGDYIFLFQGSGNYTGGLPLEASQKLIGQAANLTVGSNTLLAGDPTKRPTITNSGADVIDLDDANEVRGLGVDPQGTGGGIAGASGDSGGATIDDVRIIDSGTAGTQPGLELDSTTGAFNISNLVVNNFATGVRLHNTTTPANAVNAVFAPASQISITSSGAPGLDVDGTVAVPVSLGTSTFDDITVTNSSSGGANITNATGTTNLGDGTSTDLSLTTTSGTTPAFGLASAGTITVPSGGTANVSATGGPAIDVTSTGGPSLAFDNVASTNSATDGIRLDNVGGTFNASSGSLQNATDQDIDISGNNSADTVDVTYDGSITDDLGTLVNVSGQNGGTKDFNGTITDNNDGDGAGISLTNNTGATIRFDGGLTLSTGSNAAFSATGGGTVVVTDPVGLTDNTISTTTGTALNVANTTIGASGLTFRSISANGGSNGIVLNNTGTSGGLTVSGTGTANSGGTIQNTISHGISLTSTRDISLTSMNIQSTGGSGINGTQVTNFSFVNGTINNSGDTVAESNIAFTGNGALTGNNIAGNLTVTGSTLTNAFDSGVYVHSSDGTVTNATITGNTFTSSTSDATSKGSAVRIIGIGSASTVFNLTKATISNNTIRNFPSDGGIEVKTGNTNAGGPGATAGMPGSATNIISITGNSIRGESAANKMGTSAIDIGNSGGNSGSRSVMNIEIRDNGSAADPLGLTDGIVIGYGNTGYATMTATITNNVIVANNTVASSGIGGGNGIVVSSAETPDLTMTISGNNVSQVDGNGILVVGRGVSGTARAKILNNTVAAPLTGNRPGIRVDAGNAGSVDDAVCLQISGNTSAGSGVFTQGIGLRKEGTTATVNDFGIVGLPAGTTGSPGVENYVSGQNPAANGTLLISATSGFSTCSAF